MLSFLHSSNGVQGVFLGVYNGDEVGETNSHGEDGWVFFHCVVASVFLRVLEMELC